MTTKDDIQARLAEIQGAAAKASEVTIESLLSELEAARAKATDLDQLSAAVRAIEAKAKVSGLLIQRMEIGSPNEFAHCKTEAETVDKLLESRSPRSTYHGTGAGPSAGNVQGGGRVHQLLHRQAGKHSSTPQPTPDRAGQRQWLQTGRA